MVLHLLSYFPNGRKHQLIFVTTVAKDEYEIAGRMRRAVILSYCSAILNLLHCYQVTIQHVLQFLTTLHPSQSLLHSNHNKFLFSRNIPFRNGTNMTDWYNALIGNDITKTAESRGLCVNVNVTRFMPTFAIFGLLSKPHV